jgi:peptide/nickel transport system substrate-binding protein
MQRWLMIAALVTSAVWLGVAPADSQAPKKGGILKVGLIGEPPTLDGHATTAVITREIGINMFEGLYTLDAKLQPVPLLAEGHEALDGARRYVIRLRSDVKFHNGKSLTSADVVASLRRWGAISGSGKSIFKNVEAIEAKSPTSLEIRLKEPSGALIAALAQVDSAALIYPRKSSMPAARARSRNTSARDRSSSSSTSPIAIFVSRASTVTRRARRRAAIWPGSALRIWTSSISCQCPTTPRARRE